MAARAMNKKPFILFPPIAAAIFALSACAAAPPPPLEGAKIGGPFTLIDQNGKSRSYDEFAGQYRIVYFGYTSCPDICTPDMQNLMAGLKKFEKDAPVLGAKIQPLFITVDPARDTPPILKQFVSAFHPRLIGLTGSDTDIADAAKKFAIYFNKEPSKSSDSYIMSHSQTPYLMAPDGKPIALLPADTPQTPANDGSPDMVATELAKWVK